MNNDLISREALKNDISERLCDKFDKWNKTITVSEFETVVIDAIDNAPTVESERLKGEWNLEQVDAYDSYFGIRKQMLYKCPFCGRKEEMKYDYCHCGADLRGEKK